MTATDFEYDGLLLSDLGFMICQFDESTGFASSSAGSNLDVTTIMQNSGRKHLIVNSSYQDSYSPTFSICKKSGGQISTDEYGFIMHWLNRPKFCKLVILTPDWQQINYMCVFNLEKVEHRGKIIGFNLTAITDSAFGWGDPIQDDFVIETAYGTHDILDESDEIGYAYPDSLKITCQGDGDLIVSNSIEPDRRMKISDCTSGEIIELNGKTFEVSSSTDDNIYDRFNFTYLRIANTSLDAINTLRFTLPCSVSLIYTPARKVVF